MYNIAARGRIANLVIVSFYPSKFLTFRIKFEVIRVLAVSRICFHFLLSFESRICFDKIFFCVGAKQNLLTVSVVIKRAVTALFYGKRVACWLFVFGIFVKKKS